MMEDGLFDRFPVQSVCHAVAQTGHRGHQHRAHDGGRPHPSDHRARRRRHATRRSMWCWWRHHYRGADIVSRNVRPIESAVVSLCAIQAGDLGAFSVLPGTATLVGTVRTFDPAVQELVEQRLKELCSAIALGFGATATLHYERMYPATINTESEAVLQPTWQSLVGADHGARPGAKQGGDFRSCCRQARRLPAWGGQAVAVRCTTAGMASMTKFCRWGRRCTPADQAGHAAFAG